MRIITEYEVEKPQQLIEMNFGNLIAMCQSHLNDIEQGDLDGDTVHYIYEQAMTTVFGWDVWDFINERLR